MKKKPIKLSLRQKISYARKAQRMTEKGMLAVKRALRVGITERQLASIAEQGMRRAGCDWYAFPTIVCAHDFKNIHAVPSNYKIKKTDTVIVDIGAIYKGVHADMTRTFCLKPTKKTKELYSVVKKSHEESAAHLRPKVKARFIDKVARDIINKAGYKIPHGLGHGVGLQIHQRPSLKPRSRDKLKIGDIVTIEPGVYLPKIGIRIEDMYLITKHGAKRLTNFPKKL
jgi:Xaa-Pro aminopeptidase